MNIPWISITGVRSIADINVVNSALIKSGANIPTICNFCGSYKRLNDYYIEGEHSCSINQLIDIGHCMPKNFAGKIGLHFSPNPNGKFSDDCIKYINLMRKYFNVEQLTIISLWPDKQELEILRSKLNIDIVIQIPLYKVGNINNKEIENKVLDYANDVSAFIFDMSGGNGIEHDVTSVLDIILPIADVLSEKICIAGGLNESNVYHIVKKYFRQGILCAVDAQSCLTYGGMLDYERILGYLQNCSKFYEEIGWR